MGEAEVGLALLDVLGISKEDVHELDGILYRDLVAAGERALERTVGRRTPGTRTMFGFGPVPDGIDLLQQPFTPGFAGISKDVPLMIGTTFNELMKTCYGENALTFDGARERLEVQYGDQTEAFIALFKAAYPDGSPQDLLSIDTMFRPVTIRVADAASRRAAPVYSYMLIRKHWTGDSDEAHALADIMSSAWLNFARSGNPNVADKLPLWDADTRENGATMIFDSACRIVKHHDRELMELVLSVQKQ